MRLLPDNILYRLLQKLSSANMPAELLRMLNAMQVDGRRMPAVDDESTMDNAASSLLTSWLARARPTASQSFEGAACCSRHASLFVYSMAMAALYDKSAADQSADSYLIDDNMLTCAWQTLHVLVCLVGKGTSYDGAWYLGLTRQPTTT